jgi:two-component system, OmpR family, sensor histidine kinase ArlS
MKIRDKIILYFTTTVICLSAFSLTFVYFLFAEYREEQFQQQQKDKINYTIKQLSKYKEMSENLAHIMDEQTIHDFFDEKMMVFDADKKLIFSSIDDLEIKQYKTLLAESSSQKNWIETTEDKYDLIAVYLQYKGKEYYAISKAYDAFGYLYIFRIKYRNHCVYFLKNYVSLIWAMTRLHNSKSKPHLLN